MFIPALKGDAGEIKYDYEHVGDMFANKLSEAYIKDSGDNLSILPLIQKSIRPYMIHTHFLKVCAANLVKPLAHTINASLD